MLSPYSVPPWLPLCRPSPRLTAAAGYASAILQIASLVVASLLPHGEASRGVASPFPPSSPLAPPWGELSSEALIPLGSPFFPFGSCRAQHSSPLAPPLSPVTGL